MTDRTKNALLYLLTVIVSVALVFLLHAAANFAGFESEEENEVARAVVEKILKPSLGTPQDDEAVRFRALITSGRHKGVTVVALQSPDGIAGSAAPVKEGDKVLLINPVLNGEPQWQFMELIRSDGLIVLCVIFALGLLLFGGKKGFNSLVSLALTVAVVFAAFVPAVLSGKNIYFWSILICIYTTVMTLFIISGYTKKSSAAVIGCLAGILATGVIMTLIDRSLSLTGMLNEESVFLTYLPTENPINLRAITFAAIVIGAMGAIMDVAMSISSSLWEIKENSPDLGARALFQSGINIGRDVMGTMSNTLVLAYIGSSLSVVLLLTVYSYSLDALFNMEMIVTEILQALVGSLGILFTMPLTALVCAFLFARKPRRT